MRANSDPSTDAVSRTCPPVARTNATSLSANSASPSSRATDRAGNRRGQPLALAEPVERAGQVGDHDVGQRPEAPARDPEYRTTGDRAGAERRERGSVAADRDDQIDVGYVALLGDPVAAGMRSRPGRCRSRAARSTPGSARSGSSTFRVGWTRTPMRRGRRSWTVRAVGCGERMSDMCCPDEPYCGDVGRSSLDSNQRWHRSAMRRRSGLR